MSTPELGGKSTDMSKPVMARLINTLAKMGVLPSRGESLVVTVKHDPKCRGAQDRWLRPCRCTELGIQAALMGPGGELLAGVKQANVRPESDPELAVQRHRAELAAQSAE